MRPSLVFRLLCQFLSVLLVAGLLVVAPLRLAAAQAAPAVAKPGRGPVERPLPATATPRRGLPDATAPAEPPRTKADGTPRVPSTTEKAARAQLESPRAAAAAVGATDLVLRPGFLLGDTSLVVYFNGDVNRGDPTSWATWWATVTDTASGAEQRSATLGQADAVDCFSPRQLCHSFGAADGWVLDVARTYTVTVTVVQPDGTEVTSPASAPAHPRTTVTPPAVPAAQAVGCGCPTVLGPTLSTQARRGSTVNTATGGYSRTETDFVMSSYGIPFYAARYYSSANPNRGMFGPGWSWTYDAQVTAADNGAVRVRAEDGSEAVYTQAADGSYTRPAGIRSKLSKVDSGWQLVTPDQRTLRFDAQGRLLSVQNARGFGVTLAYDGSGLLTTVTDASGRQVRIESRADLRLITKITLPDGRSAQFDYQDGRLLKVQDPRSYTTQYRYDATGRLTEVVDAKGNSAIRNEYGTDGRVSRQTDPEGAVTAFTWDATKQQATTTDPDGVAIVDVYQNNVLLYSRDANKDTVHHRYDAQLRSNLKVDPNGNQQETAFDAEGNPVSRTAPEPFSFTEASTFDDRNNLTAQKDGRGNTWSYEFNQYNEMTGQRNPKQAQGYRYAYDDKGEVSTRTDPRGKVTRYEYDAYGDRTAEISPTGRRTEMTYDLTGRMTSVVDPRGTVAGGNRDAYRTRTVYDPQSRVTEVWEPGKSAPSRTTYDEVGNAVVSTDPLSNSSRMTYDKDSRLIEVKDPIGNVTTTTYTPGGRRASVTDGEGNKTTWTYNTEGRPASETSPRGNADPGNADQFTTQFHYDFNGNMIRADRPYGTTGQRVQIDTGFDALDRPTEQRDQFNVATKAGYDNNGNVVSMTNERGETLQHSFDEANQRTGGSGASGAAQIEYDQAGNPTRQVTPTGGVITWQYDDDGRPVAITEPRGNAPGANAADYTTHYSYDAAGNLETVTDPLGNVTRTGYDAENRPVSTTDANNKTTRYGYDAADRLAAVTGPDATSNQSTVYTYDADGRLQRTTDPLSHSTYLEYDKAGRVVASTDALGRRRDMAYDADGNLTEEVTARQVDSGQPRPDPNRPARTIFASYDNLNRPVSRKLGTTGPTYTFGYDAKNRLTEAAGPAGLEQRDYDETDRLSKVTRGADVFTYSYDSDDRVTSRTYPDGTTIGAEYDAGDRVTSLTASKGTSSARYGFDYDVADNLVKTTYPASTGVVEDRTYDRAGRLTHVGAQQGSQVLSTFDLTLDPVGNPSRITTQRGQAGQPTTTETTAYAYDPANRLLSACYGAQTCAGASAQRIDYTYDLVGNRLTQKKAAPGDNTTTTYSYDAADQLTHEVTSGTSSSDRTFDYDMEGNQTRAGGDTYNYALDHTLTSATVGGRTTSYSYDAFGNRVGSASGSGAAAVTQKWSWDVNAASPMLAVESQGSSSGTTSRGFLYDPMGSPLALLTPGATGGQSAHSYTRDWLGGVSTVVAPNGTQEWSYDYDPFGVARGSGLTDGGKKLTDDAPANPLQYAGGYHDTSQGDRYQLQARNYDPGTGRFDGQDPVAPPASNPAVSSYSYTGDRPTALTDPTGRDASPGDGMAQTYEAYYRWRAACNNNPQSCAAQNQANSGDPSGDPNPEFDSAKKLVDEAQEFIKHIGDEIVNLILDIVGFNDAKKCVMDGDIVACVMTALQAVPWGKLFKAAKVMMKAIGVGRRLMEAYGKLKAARAALANIPKYIRKAEKAAQDVADSDKYKHAADAAADAAKDSGTAAKQATKKAADGAKADRRAAEQEAGDSCKIASTRGLNSFAPGTPVVLGDGRSKPIEQVRAGDAVLATDPATGASAPQQVTATITGTGVKKLVDLTLVGAGAGGGGPPATVTATDGHKFYVPAKGWVQAVDLRVGDQLRDEAGRPVRVVGVDTRVQQATVYNLTVNDTHTYYVIAGTTPVLVHNCGPVANGKPDALQSELDHAADIGVSPVSAGTSEFDNAVSGGGRFLWAVDKGGTLRIAPWSQDLKHTVLTRGGPVLGAGEANIQGGAVRMINNFTGHYTPRCGCSAQFLQQGVEAFQNAGVPVLRRGITDLGGLP